MKRMVLIALLIILISSASAASGIKETIREILYDHWSETRTIETNEYLVFKFQGDGTNVADVSIEVMSGDSIDMLLLSSENFTDYQAMMKSGKARQFNSYAAGLGMNMKYINYSFEIPANGTYYIVEDNTYLPNNGAQPGRSVETRTKFSRSRCIECEEAALEMQKRNEAARQAEEEQRKLQEEMNRSKPNSTPGFMAVFSVSVLMALYLFVRKKT